MPCNSICSHLINKVNRYLKQRQPYLCAHINFSSPVVQLILRMTGIWEKMGGGGGKGLPHTRRLVLSLLQTDSGNYCYVVWFKIILISAPSHSLSPPAHTHTQPNPSHTGTERSLSGRLKMPAAHFELFSAEYYLKMHAEMTPLAEMRHNVGVVNAARRYSGEKRHRVTSYQFQGLGGGTSGWFRVQRKQTKPGRRHRLGADSLQNKHHQLCWLLIQFAWGLIQFQSPQALTTISMCRRNIQQRSQAKMKKKKEWREKCALIAYDNIWWTYDTHPRTVLHCYLFGHCT